MDLHVSRDEPGALLTLLHSERSKLHRILAVLSTIGLKLHPNFISIVPHGLFMVYANGN